MTVADLFRPIDGSRKTLKLRHRDCDEIVRTIGWLSRKLEGSLAIPTFKIDHQSCWPRPRPLTTLEASDVALASAFARRVRLASRLNPRIR